MQNSKVPANAHTPNEEGRWQPLLEHLDNVARLTSEFGAAFGAEDMGFWIGLWHDLGKYSQAFQAYLQDCARNPGGHQRGPDHKAAGTTIALRHLGLTSLIIQGHHGGLRTITEMKTWLDAKRADTPIDAAIEQARSELPMLEPQTPVTVPDWIRHNPYAAELFIRLLVLGIGRRRQSRYRAATGAPRSPPVAAVKSACTTSGSGLSKTKATSRRPIARRHKGARWLRRAQRGLPRLPSRGRRLPQGSSGSTCRPAAARRARAWRSPCDTRSATNSGASSSRCPSSPSPNRQPRPIARIFERTGRHIPVVLEHHSGAQELTRMRKTSTRTRSGLGWPPRIGTRRSSSPRPCNSSRACFRTCAARAGRFTGWQTA